MSNSKQLFQLLGADPVLFHIDHFGGRDSLAETANLKRQLRNLGVLLKHQLAQGFVLFVRHAAI
ncbi:hypothetical protein DXT97_12475 [Agrobacterium tumefaciens]|nr:hypothetical protein [Agrobacterium tumefaciens]